MYVHSPLIVQKLNVVITSPERISTYEIFTISLEYIISQENIYSVLFYSLILIHTSQVRKLGCLMPWVTPPRRAVL